MAISPQKQQVIINGEPHEVAIGTTLADALYQRLDVDPLHARGVAVAVNDEVVRREDWQDVHLEAGDRVEVITARQGG